MLKMGYIVDVMWMVSYKSFYKTYDDTKTKDRLSGLFLYLLISIDMISLLVLLFLHGFLIFGQGGM